MSGGLLPRGRKLSGDRVGMVVFAGDAFVQFPLTADYAAADLFLTAIDVDAVLLLPEVEDALVVDPLGRDAGLVDGAFGLGGRDQGGHVGAARGGG